jgi:hypothetical protein
MDSLKAWIEQRPKRAVMVTAVVAVIIGLVIGLGAGYKIEHDRVASDVKKLKSAGTTSTKTPKTGAAKVGGKVTTTGAASITLKVKAGADRSVNVSATTKYETATKATKADLAVGRHVFVIAPGSEVLILPAGSTLGRAITAVTGASFKLAAANGLPGGTIKVSAATAFETVKPGAKTDVKVGGQALALGTSSKAGPVDATEIITLPATSKFGG